MKPAQNLPARQPDAAQAADSCAPTAAAEREKLRLLKSKSDRTAAPPAADACFQVEALSILALALLSEVEALRRPVAGQSFNLTGEVERFEAALIRAALIRTGGRLRRAAHLLGMKVTTLHNKIKRYGIDLKEMPASKAELRLMLK